MAAGQLRGLRLQLNSPVCTRFNLFHRLRLVLLLLRWRRRRRRHWLLRLCRLLLQLLRVLQCTLPAPRHQQVALHGLQIAPKEAVGGVQPRRRRQCRPGC